MADGIYTALSGAIAQSTMLDATAANLANASTDGYQRVRPVFHEAPAGATQGAVPRPAGSVVTSTLDATPGALRTTGRGLDMAMPKGTYLAVQTDRGERYTRAGSLTVGTDGTLRTMHGATVMGEGGPIKCAPNASVTLGPSGQVVQGNATVGRLRLVSFDKPELLTPEGGTLLASGVESGDAKASAAQIEVGAVEESNTSVVGAMTDIVTATRTFEAFQRAIDAFQEADRKVVTTVPNVG